MFDIMLYYVYYYRRVGGIIGSADPNREIGFGFVSYSCRACERAGEAKLRVHVGHDAPYAGACISKIGDFAPACHFALALLLLYAWVLSIFFNSCCYMHGFFEMH